MSIAQMMFDRTVFLGPECQSMLYDHYYLLSVTDEAETGLYNSRDQMRGSCGNGGPAYGVY